MAMDSIEPIGPVDPTELDDWILRIIHNTSRFLLAHWEPGTPQGRQFDKFLGGAAQAKGVDEVELTTEFYRIAFQDPEFMAMFRRCVAAAVYLETGIPPKRDLG